MSDRRLSELSTDGPESTGMGYVVDMTEADMERVRAYPTWEKRLDVIEAKVDHILALLRTDGEAVPVREFADVFQVPASTPSPPWIEALGDLEAMPSGIAKDANGWWRKPIHDPNGGRS